MKSILYIIAFILIVGWGIGFIGYQAGGLIHILLVIALIVLLLNIFQGRKVL